MEDLKVILIGLRFHESIKEECDSVEDAVLQARFWEEPEGELQVGYAAPLRIEDAGGNVLMDQAALKEAVNGLGF